MIGMKGVVIREVHKPCFVVEVSSLIQMSRFGIIVSRSAWESSRHTPNPGSISCHTRVRISADLLVPDAPILYLPSRREDRTP